LTGLRKSEAAKLKWADVDMLDKTFTIIDTKNSDPLTLPMSDFLFSMFTQRRSRYGNYDYVFPGTGAHGHLIEPKASIYKVTQNSGVTFTCHDLRRTFLTIAESLDISHYALKRLVNHRLSDVTSGYIIANVERLRGPVEQIAQFILEKTNGNKASGDQKTYS
jgi:integrase